MWLLLLIPFTVFWPVVALVAEGTALNRYRATWGREVMALLFCLIAYFVVRFVLYQLVSGISAAFRSSLGPSCFAMETACGN